jgi:hypothetical protein
MRSLIETFSSAVRYSFVLLILLGHRLSRRLDLEDKIISEDGLT